jgi:Na+/proline symporter
MQINGLDWSIIIAFFLFSMGIGVYASRQSGKNAAEFFLSGRNMPWWLLGISMVATTFSADTPNLVTDIIRKQGVAGNWTWWAFLLTGMLTVFVYAKLWRRSGILTDLEFYELRYSGGPAAFLRGFRAIYLGVFFNVMIMATVCLAGIKFGGVLLGLSPIQMIAITSIVVVFYTSLGGLRGVILTDFFQFILAMVGMVGAAYVVLKIPEVGGLKGLLSSVEVQEKQAFIPDFSNWEMLVPIFIVPLAVQWWASWYPGAEPGGGGYIAQRMLAAKNEKNAMGATLLFNIAHYALRPWPWIIIALCSIIVFPDIESIALAFPNVDKSLMDDDMAFPAMLSYLPTGLLGLVIAAIIAALMSTLSTHLNWGSSYIVNDFYARFVKPKASQKELVAIGRISTVVLMILAAIVALWLESAFQAFKLLLQIGAGTGLIFILRWFWWRINAYSEIAAMVISFIVALYFEQFYEGNMLDHQKLVIGVGVTTVGWILVTFLTRPTNLDTLQAFYQKIKPFKMGWNAIIDHSKEGEGTAFDGPSTLGLEIMSMICGCIMVYATLFATGYLIYGEGMKSLISAFFAAGAALILYRTWPKLRFG